MTAKDYSEGAFCRECGYSLRALPVPRCPECGRGFNPREPETMRVPGYPRPGQRPDRTFLPLTFAGRMMVGAAAATECMVIGAVYRGSCLFQWASVVGLLLWLGLPAAGRAWRRRPDLPPGPRYWWVGVAPCLALSMAICGVGWHSCPHATTVFLGPAGLSYSVSGGPCNNAPHHGGMHLGGNYYLAWRGP
jgi:hypothetical protein